MAFCDICGRTLKEDELEELGDRQVCHNCRYDGLNLLRERVKMLLDEGRERLQQRREEEERQEAEEAAREATTQTGEPQGSEDEAGPAAEEADGAPVIDEDSAEENTESEQPADADETPEKEQ